MPNLQSAKDRRHGGRHIRRLLATLACAAVVTAVVPVGTTIRAKHRAALSDDLVAHKAKRSGTTTRLIVHGTRAELRALAARYGVRIVKLLRYEGVFEATDDQIDAISQDETVDHLSGDLPVADFMSVSEKALAADQARNGAPGPLGIGGIAGVTGQGIGVAVLDSGIAAHNAITGKIVANVSMVAGEPATDEFGHGTHVAGIITGSGTAAAGVTTAYTGGIAPGASLINVRVLGDDGTGYTSDVIAGIDWAVQNKALYNIRVMNLSLGHSITEAAATDPLCEAVLRAYRAGIVVVVAAGNLGKMADGTPVLGGISSPGNSPYALTVGATNAWSTVARGDDTITTYSSRGPTKFDMAVKPDVVAPGNRIVSLEAPGSYLSTHYPSDHVAGSGSNAYFRMSGTSMAAPMVSGGVALLLEASPAMTAEQIKLLLQSSAKYMPASGLIGAGAGSVNLWAARQLQANGGALLPSTVVAGITEQPDGVSFWDSGTLRNALSGGTGIRLLALAQLPTILTNPAQLTWGTLNLAGGTNAISLLDPNRISWGDVYYSSGGAIAWGQDVTALDGKHLVWGDSFAVSDSANGYHLVWGDSLTTGDPDSH